MLKIIYFFYMAENSPDKSPALINQIYLSLLDTSKDQAS